MPIRVYGKLPHSAEKWRRSRPQDSEKRMPLRISWRHTGGEPLTPLLRRPKGRRTIYRLNERGGHGKSFDPFSVPVADRWAPPAVGPASPPCTCWYLRCTAAACRCSGSMKPPPEKGENRHHADTQEGKRGRLGHRRGREQRVVNVAEYAVVRERTVAGGVQGPRVRVFVIDAHLELVLRAGTEKGRRLPGRGVDGKDAGLGNLDVVGILQVGADAETGFRGMLPPVTCGQVKSRVGPADTLPTAVG